MLGRVEKGSKLDRTRESCSKARKRAEGNRGEESEATGPDIGPVLSPPLSPHSAFGRFSPLFVPRAWLLLSLGGLLIGIETRQSLAAPCTSTPPLSASFVISRASLAHPGSSFFSSWLHLFSTRSLALSSCFFASSPSSYTYYR